MLHKDEVARALAQKHFQIEQGIERILRIRNRVDVENEPREPVKLLEVNQFTVASGIVPVHFAPDPENGIDYATVIVEVTPEEFDLVVNGELELPDGWKIDEEILREEPITQ